MGPLITSIAESWGCRIVPLRATCRLWRTRRDVLAVLDAVARRGRPLRTRRGRQLCAMLAATAPERVRSLFLYTTPISTRQYAYEDGDDDEEIARSHEDCHRTFGTPAFDELYFEILAPSYMHDVELYAFFSRLQRHVASPARRRVHPPAVRDRHLGHPRGSPCRRRCCIEWATRSRRSAGAGGWPRRSPAPSSSSWTAPTGGRSSVIRTGSWMSSSGSSWAIPSDARRRAPWRPCSSPTSSVPPSERRRWATPGGRALLARHDALARRRSPGSAPVTSTRPATASWRASTAGPGDTVRAGDRRGRAGLGLEIRAGVHAGEVEHDGDSLRGSRSTSAHGSPPRHELRRCWCPRPSKTWSRARAAFEDAGSTS